MSVDRMGGELALLEELRASEARFRAICEAAPLGIYVSEIPNGVVYVNPAMQRILGRTQEELSGTLWQQYLHPDDRKRALADRAARYEKSSLVNLSARYLRSDGKVIWTMVHAAPILEEGTLRGYIGMLEDITENKALQAQLVMAGRLASVGTMAAGVAHEVNTPLAVMLSNLEWIAKRISEVVGDLDGAGREQKSGPKLVDRLRALEAPLSDAREAAQRVRVIMQDLTLFSRPEAGEQGTADLKRVLASATRMASHELKHRARLSEDYGDLPPVQGSEARLGQVFLNLLINAAHAVPEGQADEHQVSIHARVSEPGMVMVEVEDSGVGIKPEAIEHVFEPFFTTKTQGRGTGLGLSICHRIVTGLGGRMEVESVPSRGSVFRVILPTGEVSAGPPASPEQASRPPVGRRRILVIDDDAMLLRSISMLLADKYEVLTMSRAREALEALQGGARYDAVLCDLMMPDMDGMEFHQALSRTLPELADQVIFVTGGAVTSSARAFLEGISNRQLDKPFTLEQLKGALAERARD